MCFFRAQAVNPQIGREEYSAFIRLTVTGDAPAEIAPEIVVKPADKHIVKGEAAVDLHCIANARYTPECFHIVFVSYGCIDGEGFSLSSG